MVDYRGPDLLKPLADRLPVPIFNRVREISYSVGDVAGIDLEPADLSRLTKLERISFSAKSFSQIDETDVKKVETKVPPCRLSSTVYAADQKTLRLEVKPGTALTCSASMQ